MKNIISTALSLLIALLMTFPVFSQNFQFDVYNTYRIPQNVVETQPLRFELLPNYSTPIPEGSLSNAAYISDIGEGYPTSWVTEYVSTSISAICQGKLTTAVGINNTLTEAQKDILKRADIGKDVTVNVIYKYKNPVTEAKDTRNMNFSVSLVPKVEATYIGGKKALDQYLNEHILYKIAEADAKKGLQASVKFIINEEGKVIQAQIIKSSNIPQVDKLLLNAINNMPNWTAAKSSKNIKIKQEFIFTIGNIGGC